MQQQCRYCKNVGSGAFCSACGEPYENKRLSLGSIIHEAAHFFTHLDKGFPYTLKQLINQPGTMQKTYVEGYRKKYQKPFAMYFLCATISALVIYWINILLIKNYDAGDNKEALFFSKYWALLQVALLPVYAFITWLIFKFTKFNYGEILVLQLYQFSMLFIFLAIIHLLKFMFLYLETRYIEVPVILIYTTITNLRFFAVQKKWIVILLTILSITICFALASSIQDFLVDRYF